MKKILTAIKNFFTGGPVIESSSTTASGEAKYTVYPTTDGQAFEPAAEPAPAPMLTQEELPDEAYEDLAEVKLWAAAPSGGTFKNGKPKKALTARETYKKTYGQKSIPKGHVVYHINGDETNFHISNLATSTRAWLLKQNVSR
jgi:hypothetical protein